MIFQAHDEKNTASAEPRYEVAGIFRLYGEEYRENHRIPTLHHRVMDQIEKCRTADMGGHTEQCDQCGFRRNAYNSCGNRHCPKCHTGDREKWLNDRRSELLPVGYFHNVFTLPHELNPLILCNMEIMLNILFAAVSETLQVFASDPQWKLKGQLGFIAVLHTWSQTLMDHFHLHCLIPGGALSFDKSQWNPSNKKFLFKTASLAKEFKKRYIDKLLEVYENDELIFPGNTTETGTIRGFQELIDTLWSKEWIVYSKKPFSGPEKVLEYLGRYTHRVAISNHRIKSIDNGQVVFTYRDREDDYKMKEMTLKADEFIRRFLLHILPKNYMKIRYFGFMFHRDKKENIEIIRKLITPDTEYKEPEKETLQEIMLRLTGTDITLCPECGRGRMVQVCEIPKGGYKGSIYCNSP